MDESKKYRSEEWLREQYIDQDRTQTDIAEECNVSQSTIRNWRDKYNIYKGRKCPLCDHQSESLGTHFIRSEHGHPDIDQYKWEILVGHMMGDASYGRGSKNGYVVWHMTNLDYMKWLNRELGWMCNDPYLSRTPEQSARNNFLREVSRPAQNDKEKRMFSSDPDSYKPIYTSRTVTHPLINKLDWMEDGKKKFPETLKLTQTMVKIWYCDDGGLSWHSERSPFAIIGATSQMGMLDLLADKFADAVCRPVVSNGRLRFNVNETEKLIDWMGDPPDGMEYKFCLESEHKYDRLKP